MQTLLQNTKAASQSQWQPIADAKTAVIDTQSCEKIINKSLEVTGRPTEEAEGGNKPTYLVSLVVIEEISLQEL